MKFMIPQNFLILPVLKNKGIQEKEKKKKNK